MEHRLRLRAPSSFRGLSASTIAVPHEPGFWFIPPDGGAAFRLCLPVVVNDCVRGGQWRVLAAVGIGDDGLCITAFPENGARHRCGGGARRNRSVDSGNGAVRSGSEWGTAAGDRNTRPLCRYTSGTARGIVLLSSRKGEALRARPPAVDDCSRCCTCPMPGGSSLHEGPG